MSQRLNDVAVIGLGVMGGNLARNFASRGLKVAGYTLDLEQGKKLAADHPEAQLHVAPTVQELVASLERPRRIVLLVNAGKPVDSVLDGLDPLLDDGDIVVDGGNSLYTDTDARLARPKKSAWQFMGMGVSGGSDGALKGPSIMPGGTEAAWERMRPVLEKIAAVSRSGVCVTHCGAGSAGHFVKMVHNGIEYGDMQLIAEAASVLREGLALTPAAIAGTFDAWNRGALESFLVEITADIFRAVDPQKADGSLLLDAVQDQAGQKGTGKWTVIVAAELGVAIPVIASAVDSRILSAGKALRLKAHQLLSPARSRLGGVTEDDLAQALYAAKIASYTQGFALLSAASERFGYDIPLSEVARIWTGGCIIRAAFLERVQEAFSTPSRPELLVLAPSFAQEVAGKLPALRRVVSAAAAAGLAIPGFAAALSWFDSLSTPRGTGAVIQAQRDYFGSHTYERVDKPGVAVHSDWAELARKR